jgi:transposase-like protein
VQYLILEAGDETMRHGGMVRDAAVLSTIGTGQEERRVAGVCMALSEAGVHWLGFPERGFPGLGLLDGLVARGLRGVAFITPDDHAELHAVRNAGTLAGAEAALAERVASWRDSAPKRANWPEQNVPEARAVFTRPAPHRRRLFT